jgi:hypothetical protein
MAIAGRIPDHHGFGIQNTRHGGDIAEHATNEGIANIPSGNIYQATRAPVWTMASAGASCSVMTN